MNRPLTPPEARRASDLARHLWDHGELYHLPTTQLLKRLGARATLPSHIKRAAMTHVLSLARSQARREGGALEHAGGNL